MFLNYDSYSSLGKKITMTPSLRLVNFLSDIIVLGQGVAGEACSVPILKVLPKLHKPPKENGDTKTRPIVGASSGLTARTGDFIADILDCVTQGGESQEEALSTEDVLNKLEDAATRVKDEGERIVVASVDAVGLYPNLNPRAAARQCNKEISESEVKMPDIDLRSASIFLAATMERKEIVKMGLHDFVPVRRSKMGKVPGLVKGSEITSRTVVKDKKDNCDPEPPTKVTFGGSGSKWGVPRRQPEGKDKMRLIGMVVEVAILIVTRNHHYRFGGNMYRQEEGLPIGSRLTGSIARICTDQWSRGMDLVLEENLVKRYLKEKYVDDVNLVVEAVGLGVRWKEGTLRWTQECEDQDRNQGRTHDSVTTQVLVEMANSVDPNITFTGEGADDHEGGRVPMLDLKVWRSVGPGGEELLRHCYYEKPITSKMMVMAKSALPMKTKMTVLAQEIIRRMRNTSPKLPVSMRVSILNTMMVKMRSSGYDQGQREEALYSGVLGYCRMVAREEQMGRRINRQRDEGAQERREKKILGDTTWFLHKEKEQLPDLDSTSASKCGPRDGRKRCSRQNRKKHGLRDKGPRTTTPEDLKKTRYSGINNNNNKDQLQPETVLFVPMTGSSKLRKTLQEKDNQFAKLHKIAPVRFVERGGRKLSKVLGVADPWGGVHCGRQGCKPCEDPTLDDKLAAPRGICSQENCLYSLECLICENMKPKISAHYYGETGRAANTRGKEHSEGVGRGDINHPIVKHMIEHHGGMEKTKPEWRMRVLRVFKKPLQRQVAEGCLIEKSNIEMKLNSKSEWHSARLPRLQVEVGSKVDQEEYRGTRQPKRYLEPTSGAPVSTKRQGDRRQKEENEDWNCQEQGCWSGGSV